MRETIIRPRGRGRAGRRARGWPVRLCQWLIGHVFPLTVRRARRSVSRPYWVAVHNGLEHSFARLALSQSGCPLSFLSVSRFLFHGREPARVLGETLSVRRADLDLKRVAQPVAGQRPFPANAVPAQVCSPSGRFSSFVNLYCPLRTANNANQLAFWLHLPTLNAGPQGDMLGRHHSSRTRSVTTRRVRPPIRGASWRGPSECGSSWLACPSCACRPAPSPLPLRSPT